jgi:hypothetical protein
MSGRIRDAIVDSAAFSLAFDRVHYAFVRSFLVRNWCGLGPKLRWSGCSEPRPVGYYADLLAHNLKVIGSNPIPATKLRKNSSNLTGLLGFAFDAGIDANDINDLAWRFKSPRNQTYNRIRARDLAHRRELFWNRGAHISYNLIREIFFWRRLIIREI